MGLGNREGGWGGESVGGDGEGFGTRSKFVDTPQRESARKGGFFSLFFLTNRVPPHPPNPHFFPPLLPL